MLFRQIQLYLCLRIFNTLETIPLLKLDCWVWICTDLLEPCCNHTIAIRANRHPDKWFREDDCKKIDSCLVYWESDNDWVRRGVVLIDYVLKRKTITGTHTE